MWYLLRVWEPVDLTESSDTELTGYECIKLYGYVVWVGVHVGVCEEASDKVHLAITN